MRWLFGLFVGEVLAYCLASSLGCVAQGLLLNGNYSHRCFRGAKLTISWGLSFLANREDRAAEREVCKGSEFLICF